MAIACTAPLDAARRTTFDPMRLGDRFIWDWVKGKTLAGRVVHAVALVGVLKLDRLERDRAIDHSVRKAVDLDAARRDISAKIRVHASGRTNERNVAGRCR